MQLDVIRLRHEDGLALSKAAQVLTELRPEDLYEFSAVGTNPNAIAEILPLLATGDAWLFGERLQASPRTGVTSYKGVFVWGVFQYSPGIWKLWGFGTKRTRRAMPFITRWGVDEWLRTFQERYPGARRIEVRVPVSSVHSIGWLRRLGMEIEACLPNYSVHGEAFYQLAMTFPKVIDHVHSADIRSSPVSAGTSSSAEQNVC